MIATSDADPTVAAACETAIRHQSWRIVPSAPAIAVWRNVATLRPWLDRALAVAANTEGETLSAAEWLLDNAYQVQRAILLIRQDLPTGFYNRLHGFDSGDQNDAPRLLVLAHDLLRVSHNHVSRSTILAYLDGYQRHLPLTIAELWALPVMLRLACLERLVCGFETLFPSVPKPFPITHSARLAAVGSDPTENVSRALANLGIISTIVWKGVFDAASRVEHVLQQDPSSTYPAMDFVTRDSYRRSVERLASRSHMPETVIAQTAITLATTGGSSPRDHVGYWLAGEGLPELERAVSAPPSMATAFARLLLGNPGKTYAAALFVVGLAGVVVPAVYLLSAHARGAILLLGLVLSALPASILSVTFVNWIITMIVAPRRLAKLDFTDAIPPAFQTIVAVPVLVGSPAEVSPLLERLQAHYLGNPQAARFVLLSDPCDAACERTDADAAIEQALSAGIETLNRKYGKSRRHGPFCLLHRPRLYNPAQGCWMARERKRGKLEDFNQLLLTRNASAFTLTSGPVHTLFETCFVVTADADTRLPPGVVDRLAGAMAHPLNRPVFDATGRVVRGYTVLQPRVEIVPQPGGESRFARLFGGDTTVDIYSRAVSDVYQDLTGTGNYAGKGIYDVAAFTRSLDGRIPENALLSHDLWEGLHGRTGLASDIIVYESFPASYGEFVRRWHRWIRGDWQLLPWLLPHVPGPGGSRLANRLTLFERLRLWDNLRRSLVPSSVVALLLGGWLLLPGQPWIWTLLGVAAPGAYLFTDLVTGLARGRRRGVLDGTLHRLGEHLARWSLSICFLVSDSVVSLHAIGTTLWRLHRQRALLEWTPAAQVARRLDRAGPRQANWRMLGVSSLTAIGIAAALASQPDRLLAALPVLLLWLAAPEISLWTGRRPSDRREHLSTDDRQFLRLVARRSWVYFESYIRPEENWLPPDNHQEQPVEATAFRTSPTNVGLMLLATLTAWRCGHIGTHELVLRTRNTLDAVKRLETWRGHMLNWYDTRTLAPLEPRYVSTVDSGNLAVSLITLQQGLAHLAQEPAFSAERWAGLDDCLALLAQAVVKARFQSDISLLAVIAHFRKTTAQNAALPANWSLQHEFAKAQIQQIKQQIAQLLYAGHALPEGSLRELRLWLERSEHHLDTIRGEFTTFLPWLDMLANPPADCFELAISFTAILDPARPLAAGKVMAMEFDAVRTSANRAAMSEAGALWLGALATAAEHGLAAWSSLARRAGSVGRRAGRTANAMDFRPLYDTAECLFHIGYNLDADRLDHHHYDLLASEARLASYFAIAKHDVPQEHWLQLGRPIVKKASGHSLASWNGSMFEYLMPTLFLRSDPLTLLGQSERTAVDLQRAHGRAHGIPWGISESAYASVGPDNSWRYHAFGLSDLGLRRGLSRDMVIAPYATVLALAVRPHAATQNLRAMAELGMLGRCGFYEAADFTPERRRNDEPFALVESYMAHHHGMSLGAIGNALFDNLFVTWFHSDPRIGAVDLLLNERFPWELPPEIEHVEPTPVNAAGPGTIQRPVPWLPEASGQSAALHLIGNGRMATRIATDGSGTLTWQGRAVTCPGKASGPVGQFLYLRDCESGTSWSPTSEPLGAQSVEHGHFRTTFHAHKAEYHHRAHAISSTLEVLGAAAADIEIRRLRLVNEASRPRRLDVISHAEMALAPAAEWLRHPAFAKMFVRCDFLPELHAIVFERRQRSPDEAPMVVLQRLVAGEGDIHRAGWECDRSRTLPRHGGVWCVPEVRADDEPRPTFPLDPVSALRAQVLLPAHGEVELALLTIAGASRSEVIELAERHASLAALDWVEQDALNRAAHELQGLSIAPHHLPVVQHLYDALHCRQGSCIPTGMTVSREDLWALGLSGDVPVLVHATGADGGDDDDLRLLLAAHRLWSRRGSLVDLVVLHPGLPGYIEPTRERLIGVMRESASDELLGQRGGVHLIGREQIDPRRLAAVLAAARVTLGSGNGTIPEQLAQQRSLPTPGLQFVPVGRAPLATPAELPSSATPASESALAMANGLGAMANGLGRFADDGAYLIELSANRTTPAPWVNVMANAGFGSIVSEAGMGCTFAVNSGEHRITPWHNDALADPQSEAVYLRDEETGEFWTITPLPAGDGASCRIEHRPGETRWQRISNGLEQDQRCFVAAQDPVKVVTIRLGDRLGRARRMTATFFAQLQIGAINGEPAPYRQSRYAPELQALLAENAWSSEFAGRVAFLCSTLSPHSLTTSLQDFLGSQCDWRRPRGLTDWNLGGRTQNRGEDAAVGLQVHVDIPANGTVELTFILGEADNAATAADLIAQWREPARAAAEADGVKALWDKRCGAVSVRTPDPDFDVMINRWLPYQTMSSRVFARAGYYQAGGAFGFRDQLQDVLALLHADPALARSHILSAAAHQFEDGDVLHWWHPPAGRGVRTRCSDDLLWLPFAVAAYVQATGDTTLLDARAPFLAAAPLGPDEHDRYALFLPAEQDGTLLDHCERAVERAWQLGAHGLPLMGGGDWNDGMDRVGSGGRGESVWLAWFMAATIRGLADVIDRDGHRAFGDRWRGRADQLVAAIDASAWDGGWYMRAFDDLGRPWGSATNDECQIDSLTQSWATMTGGGDPDRAKAALDAAFGRLVRHDDNIARLLDPPFAATARDPGYIKAYPPGIRENGGQYSHAAAWLGIACAMAGDGDRAKSVFDRITPASHTATPADAARYRAEPYAVAADIAGDGAHCGRAGWSWYTGAAGWTWRLGVEYILGIRLQGGGIALSPCLPLNWPGYSATLRRDGDGEIEITVRRGAAAATMVDGIEAEWPIAFPGAGRRRQVDMTIPAIAEPSASQS